MFMRYCGGGVGHWDMHHAMCTLELLGDYAKTDSLYELSSGDEDQPEDEDEPEDEDVHAGMCEDEDMDVDGLGNGEELLEPARLQEELDEVEEYGYAYHNCSSDDSDDSNSMAGSDTGNEDLDSD